MATLTPTAVRPKCISPAHSIAGPPPWYGKVEAVLSIPLDALARRYGRGRNGARQTSREAAGAGKSPQADAHETVRVVLASQPGRGKRGRGEGGRSSKRLSLPVWRDSGWREKKLVALLLRPKPRSPLLPRRSHRRASAILASGCRTSNDPSLEVISTAQLQPTRLPGPSARAGQAPGRSFSSSCR